MSKGDDALIQDLAHNYHAERGTNPKGKPTGMKLLEEVGELLRAIESGKRLDMVHEIADVAIALSYIAEYNEVSIPDAIRAKTAKDRGRGKKNGQDGC